VRRITYFRLLWADFRSETNVVDVGIVLEEVSVHVRRDADGELRDDIVTLTFAKSDLVEADAHAEKGVSIGDREVNGVEQLDWEHAGRHASEASSEHLTVRGDSGASSKRVEEPVKQAPEALGLGFRPCCFSVGVVGRGDVTAREFEERFNHRQHSFRI